MFELRNMDAIDFLKELDNESVDLVVTDPAYESLEKHRKIGTTTRLKKEWFNIFPNERFPEFFTQVYRVLKNDRHFYMLCDQETMFVVKSIAEDAGFKFWKPLIWDKVNIGMGYHYRSRYEIIMFFEKGKRKLRDLSVPDIIEAKRVVKKYPTEKPVELARILIAQSTCQGEIVCDPFMGSASVGDACLTENRKFIGNDLSKNAFNIAEKRLSHKKQQLALF